MLNQELFALHNFNTHTQKGVILIRGSQLKPLKFFLTIPNRRVDSQIELPNLR